MPGRTALTFRALKEATPGRKLKKEFRRHWPGYRKWFLTEGDAARPTYLASRRHLNQHMPELTRTYDQIIDLIGAGDRQARCLALYCPTPFSFACSQTVWTRGSTALIRNYDYSPRLCDGLVLWSNWHGTRVMGLSDCLWGILDGLNEHGLAVSLAFGGRKVVGQGFGVTLILRYILETCATVGEAVTVLRRVPVHMAYNIALLDRAGDYSVAFIAPDRETRVRPIRVSTNFQERIEWTEHALFFKTMDRQRFLEQCVIDPQETCESLVQHHLRPPLYRPIDEKGWGTLYTSCYFPEIGGMQLSWPDLSWTHTFDSFEEGERAIHYRSDPRTKSRAARS